MHIEGAKRIFVVGSHKHNDRQVFSGDLFDDLKPILPRHLNIKKQQVRMKCEGELDRLLAVPSLPNDLDVRLTCESYSKRVSRERLVVSEQGCDRAGHADTARAITKGIVTRTDAPPPRAVPISNR